MNPNLRRLVVSGGATIVLLGGAAATASAATPEHEATILAIAQAESDGTDGITNGLTPDTGSGSQLQNPNNTGQLPAGYQQQITTQASGAAIGTGVVAILLLGVIVFFRVKGGHLKVGDAVVVVLLGVALAGTVIGGLADQITDNGVASLGGVLGGL